uniref:Uncharacterized protein n=1 Tax=Aegilops tauschii TaxID=37682 RepID=M8C965_AEGTA
MEFLMQPIFRTRVGLAGRTRMKLVPAKSSMEARHRGGSAAAPVAACAHVVIFRATAWIDADL